MNRFNIPKIYIALFQFEREFNVVILIVVQFYTGTFFFQNKFQCRIYRIYKLNYIIVY